MSGNFLLIKLIYKQKSITKRDAFLNDMFKIL